MERSKRINAVLLLVATATSGALVAVTMDGGSLVVLVGLLVVVLALIAAFAVLLYANDVKQERKLLAGFRALKGGEYDYRIDLRGSDDWERIGDQFNELALVLAERDAELRAERDRFAALFENVPDPVVSLTFHDDEPMVRSVNSAFEDVFGYEAAEITGESLDEYLVDPDRSAEARDINRRIQAGHNFHTEVRRKTATGVREFLLYVVPVKLDQQSVNGFAVYTDITKRKQHQHRLQVLNRVLRHDLRNSMTVIAGNTEILRDELDDELAARATAVSRRVDELLSLVEKTRRIEETLDGEDSVRKRVELVSTVETALATTEEHFVSVRTRTDLPDRATVYGNDLLESAVENVLENAVVHNDQPETRLSVRLEEATSDYVSLAIADNGPGIPTAERELITGEREITQTDHGSGLGLWLTNWVVTRSGGELLFEDNDPRGTVVTMRLPRADAAP